MSSIRKRGDAWEASIYRKVSGKQYRKTATFTTKAEAVAWSNLIESQINAGKTGKAIPGKNVGDLFQEAISKLGDKPSERWERIRLNLFSRNDLAKVQLTDLNQTHLAEWRDKRSKEVSDGTVRREFALLSRVFRLATDEWKWIQVNPCQGVKMPKSPPARDATWNQDEIDRMLVALGHQEKKPTTIGQWVAMTFLFSLETACRAGEILDIRPSDISGRVANIKDGKTAAARRDVPLSPRAMEILELVGGKFDITSRQLDANFRRAKGLCAIEDKTFHDARATAITKLAKKLDILDLARMVGHKDLKMLMVYYREGPDVIASKLQ